MTEETLSELEQSAVNAFNCLEIEPKVGHELIIYANSRDIKGEYVTALANLATEYNMKFKTIWTEDYKDADEKIIPRLKDEFQDFFTTDDARKKNVIEVAWAGSVRNAVIKKFVPEEIGAYALSMPSKGMDCINRLLGSSENNPFEMYEKAQSLITELNKATEYRITSHDKELVIPWNNKDAAWVTSVGLIKKQNRKLIWDNHAGWIESNKPMWGNCGGEIFSAVPESELENVYGELAIDGLVGGYAVPKDEVIFLPVEGGEVQVDNIYTKSGEEPAEELLNILYAMAKAENGLKVGEIPAIGLTKGVKADSGEPLEVEKQYGLLHTGIGDPEGERGTGPAWSSLSHQDMIMNHARLDAKIDDEWVTIVDNGEIVHPTYSLDKSRPLNE